MEDSGKPGKGVKLGAAVCKYCPLCRAARKNPSSLIGRVLHHPFHAHNCPAWKAYNRVYGQPEAGGQDD